MALFDHAVQSVRSLFGDEPDYSPFGNMPSQGGYGEMDAYRDGATSYRGNFRRNGEGVLETGGPPQGDEPKPNTHQFRNGTTVSSIQDERGNTVTTVSSKPGQFTTTERDPHDFDIRYNKDGQQTCKDRSSGTSMTTRMTKQGLLIDCAQFNPAGGRECGFSVNGKGTMHLSFSDGNARLTGIDGAVYSNSVFIKGEDGGIRTVDGKGNMVLADPKAIPTEVSRSDMRKHKAAVKETKNNPQPDMHAAPQAPMQPSPQPAAPQQGAQTNPLSALFDECKADARKQIEAAVAGLAGMDVQAGGERHNAPRGAAQSTPANPQQAREETQSR